MSKEYENQDPLEIAKQAERDLNSSAAKEGKSNVKGGSDSTNESGIDESAVNKFPGATVQVGGTGAGDNREIPIEEGGSVDRETGQLHKAVDFDGPGGPEDKKKMEAQTNPGSDEVRENIR